jgi:hypothetical protein
MTYKNIQDMAIKRFKEAQRPDLKQWIQLAYENVWNLERWSFRYGTDLVTVTANSADVSNIPGNLGVVEALLRSDGTPLDALQPHEYSERYYGSTIQPGGPEAFTVIGGGIKVGPPSNETKTDYQLVHERAVGYYPSTTLGAAVTLPASSIQVVSTSELPSSGSAWVGGRLVTYTSKDATHLLGAAGGSGTIPIDSLVVSTTAKAGPLSADTDVPLLPQGTHMLLVTCGPAHRAGARERHPDGVDVG